MKIHEYQAKEILKKYGLPIPKGEFTDTTSNVDAIYQNLGTKTVVVKAQIHAGGRGKGGGVKLAHSKEEAVKTATSILGMQLVTHQTGTEGKKVLKILVEEGMDILQEYYLGITLDREFGKPVFIASTEGGMEIEKVAAESPDKIIRTTIEPNIGLQAWQASYLAFALGLSKEQAKIVKKMLMQLWNVYNQEDCSLIEINPMVTLKDGRALALDCKINFDENASFRHPEHESLRDTTEEDSLELEASKYNLNYVRLDGNVGCMVNGAGLAMATMDIIKYAGAEPANFLDVGGGANVDTVTNGFKIILSDSNVKAIFVNIFGGIVRCDRIAKGIIEAAKNVDIHVPLIVRLAGTNAEEARQILENSDISMSVVKNLQEGASKILEVLK